MRVAPLTLRYALHRVRDTASSDAFANPIHFSNSPPRSRGALFAPGLCIVASLTPMRGGRSAERRSGARRSTRWARSNVACQALARRLASHDAGRSPPRRSTVAVLGSGSALPSAALAPDWLQRACSQPGPPGMRGPGPLPGQAVTSRRRRTPLLAPPSGSSLEDAPR